MNFLHTLTLDSRLRNERRCAMRSLVVLFAVAVTLAVVAVPAYSQVEFRAGDRGFGVRVGPDRDYYDRGWRRDRIYGRGTYARGPGCREVTVRRTLPNGDRV